MDFTLSWSDANPASAVGSYLIQQSVDGQTFSDLTSVPAPAGHYTGTVVAGHKYSFRVAAVSPTGKAGLFSDPVDFFALVAPVVTLG
jgi:hypothetical protein